MPLTPIADFEILGKSDPFFRELARIADKNKGLWSTEAEEYLLLNARTI
jgi:hypothetical protein